MNSELSQIVIREAGKLPPVTCIICPQTWWKLQDAIGHEHEVPEGYEIFEFEGQHIIVDATRRPISSEKGFRCGPCGNRHHSMKAIRLCYLNSDAYLPQCSSRSPEWEVCALRQGHPGNHSRSITIQWA